MDVRPIDIKVFGSLGLDTLLLNTFKAHFYVAFLKIKFTRNDSSRIFVQSRFSVAPLSFRKALPSIGFYVKHGFYSNRLEKHFFQILLKHFFMFDVMYIRNNSYMNCSCR